MFGDNVMRSTLVPFVEDEAEATDDVKNAKVKRFKDSSFQSKTESKKKSTK